MKTQLGQEHLDASQLAGLTNSNPIYFITNTPEHGKIMRIVRSSNPGEKPTRDREVWQFTHEEVKNGVIYFRKINHLALYHAYTVVFQHFPLYL